MTTATVKAPRARPASSEEDEVGEGELAGKVALVTGGSRGIGRGIAEALAARGAAVAVTYRSDRASADATVGALVAGGGRALAVPAELGRPDSLVAAFDRAAAELGPLDVVVANAASYTWCRVEDVTEGDFDAVFDANARGTFFTLREGARRLGRGGRIVAISASGTGARQEGHSLYHGSKAAIEHVVRILAVELGPRGVTVNAVSPGPTRTEMLDQVDPEARARLEAAVPLGRLGEVAEVAEVVAFVVGPSGGWVTGQVIRANGGFT